MKKAILLSCILLLASGWLAAQKNDQSAGPSVNWGDTSGPNDVAVRGCLTGSDGSILLRDSSGTVWQLAGNVPELKAVSGHEVLVVGTRGGTGAEAAPAGHSVMESDVPESMPWTLSVSKVRSISQHCTEPR
jgi:hypothetical protein